MGYDIIVMGAGSGGLNIASFMNKAGFKVLLIDKTDANIGGDCLNFGCVPSKALIHVSRLMHAVNDARSFGLKPSGSVDIKKVMAYVKSKQDIIRRHENAAYFRGLGMDVELGTAQFTSPNSISIDGNIHTAKRIVLATGSRPRELKIPGIERVNVLTNENIFTLQKLPIHLVVIGGGPIGIELGQCFNRFGSKVTVIDTGPQFLPKERPEIANVLHERLVREGLNFLFNSSPVEFTSSNTLIVKNKGGKTTKVEFDTVLVSIGRQLNTEGLALEKANIEMDGRKIRVSNHLQTTNKRVYLCGDIAGGFQFTHAAELHAGVILNNFFSPFKKKLNNDSLSWVTYTSPEIGTFGINEAEILRRKIPYEKLEYDFKEDDRSITDDYTDGKLVLFISKNKLLGGSMVAMNAGELFQELVLAQSTGLSIKSFFNKIYPYPTAARVNKRLITNHFSKKLTPFAKKLLKWMY